MVPWRRGDPRTPASSASSAAHCAGMTYIVQFLAGEGVEAVVERRRRSGPCATARRLSFRRRRGCSPPLGRDPPAATDGVFGWRRRRQYMGSSPQPVASLPARLVDELHMMVGAGVLVDGVPAFSVRPPGPMRLTGARQLGDSKHRVASLLAGLTRSRSRPITIQHLERAPAE